MKRILALADIHAGSLYGLTPPRFFVNKLRFPKLYRLQKEMWDSYLSILKKVGKVDVALILGDVIEGKGRKAGGTEHITTDLLEQADIAVEVLSHIKADKLFFTYGTSYHTVSGSGEDIDKVVADRLNSAIDSHLYLDVEGVTFDCRHHQESSSNPHGRLTPLSKSKLWNNLQSIRKTAPNSDVILRGHSHYYTYCGEEGWLAMSLPALQSGGTKFGARRCEGCIDWGMVEFMVEDKKLLGFQAHVKTLLHGKANVVKV